MVHQKFMRVALKEAEKSLKRDEVPVGAVITRDGKIVSRSHNLIRAKHDPAGHAEIKAIRKAAAKLGYERLNGCTLYVTLEPCAMCAGAILLSRVDRLVYGAADPKTGACKSVHHIINNEKNNHKVEVIEGVLKEECSAILKVFFKGKRK
ncbi:MAG: tRNA adenosine(34) deaminase TadA [Spirochaetia bacterium]|nr:tRNA adenosine(34) deaminase TadA [Spirochaetia bacterium]